MSLKPAPRIPAALLTRYSQVFPTGHVGGKMRDVLVARRKRHLETLDSFAVFAGIPREPGSENIWIMSGLRIFQEPALMHLTGINQPGLILALDPLAKKNRGEVILFLPPKDPRKEFWDGVRLGYPIDLDMGKGKAADRDLADVEALTGIADLRPVEEFEAWFQERVSKAPKGFAYTFYHDYADPKQAGKRLTTRTDHNFAFHERLQTLASKMSGRFEIRSCATLHYRLRLPLETDQVRDVVKANVITGEAFDATLKAMPTLRDENEVAAHLEWGMRRRSPFGLSFPSIVASGKNATVLHYLKNDDKLDRKGLLLLDFGARWGTMHADITRTVPVNGRYNPLQELLYRIVLEANEAAAKACRPGMTIRDLNRKAWEFIESSLEERFLSKGGKMQRGYEGQPHGLSHLMGEQEHDGDPHRLYQDQPLQPGWQISNEPGLYGHFSISLRGKRYSEWIGIRVEDDLLVTAKGCRNLSQMVPKKPEEIEKLMAK
jgi:Xaa-Pro aminopeptidase